MNHEYAHLGELDYIVSSVTGRRIGINPELHKFWINPDFNQDLLLDAMHDWEGTLIPLLQAREVGRISAAGKSWVDEIWAAQSADQLADAVNSLVENLVAQKSGGCDKSRAAEYLQSLWNVGLIAFPREISGVWPKAQIGKTKWITEQAGRESFTEMVQGFEDRCKDAASVQVARNRVRGLIDISLACIGLVDVGDISPEVYRACNDGRTIMVNSNMSRSLPRLIVDAAILQYGRANIPWTVVDYAGWVRKPSARGDGDFEWVLEQDTTLHQWKELASTYFNSMRRSRSHRLSALNSFMDHLISDVRLPREPIEYLRSVNWSNNDLKYYTSDVPRYVNLIQEFLDWLISQLCVVPDENDFPFLLPGFSNPIGRTKLPTTTTNETTREAMPTKYVVILNDLLTENSCAVPKELGKGTSNAGGDYFLYLDTDTGESEYIWSPIRNNVILTKLSSPFRTFQVRMLNSGEADEEYYNITTRKWEPNEHELAGTTGKSMGVIRRRGKDLVLYINTNKTNDINKDESLRGYEVPWNDDVLLGLFTSTRLWQEKYNPMYRSTAWSDLKQREITGRYSKESLEERGREIFLFRDPCSDLPDQPISIGKVDNYWGKVLVRLEKSLEEMGIPEKLVLSYTKQGQPGKLLYDLHSLRVRWITAMAENGVDTAILMKVVGHSTAIMTAYYQKHSVAHVTNILNEGAYKAQLSSQQNWQKYLQSKSYEELNSLVASSSDVFSGSASRESRASWVRLDFGICPVGCRECHVGGPVLYKRVDGFEVHGPTPGPGGRNCVRCRFFFTGPPFLIGLQSRFNEVSMLMRDASKNYNAADKEFKRLNGARIEARSKGEPFEYITEWDIASGVLDQRTIEIDELALTWHATFNLLQNSLDLLRRGEEVQEDGGFSLIVNNDSEDLEFVVEVADDNAIDLELFDNVCQSAVFYRSVDPTIPNLKRMRMFDAFLAREGLTPVFSGLTEEEGLLIGNELAKFMYTQFPREQVHDFVRGNRLLRSLGYENGDVVRSKIARLTNAEPSRLRALEDNTAFGTGSVIISGEGNDG